MYLLIPGRHHLLLSVSLLLATEKGFVLFQSLFRFFTFYA
jgi:hypothetical protein